MSSREMRRRKWLREASMRRLSQLVKDKTELIDSAQKLKINISSVEGLEGSGLSKITIQHLESWVEGVESGRQCMFALLDTLHSNRDIMPPSKAAEFRPLNVVQSLLNLPEQFLCDNGYLYEKVFSRPPATVVKEAVQIIVKKAEEQNSSSLGLQQINLALKQLRLDAMCGANPIVEPIVPPLEDSTNQENERAENGDKVEVDSEKKDTETAPVIDDNTRQLIVLRVKIITELLRIHIKTTLKRKSSYLSGASSSSRYRYWEDDFDEADEGSLPDVDLKSLRDFVSTPVQTAQTQALESTQDSLEHTNSLLKPYLRRLSSLKMLLTSQLNELRDNKAFLSLGLSSDASDEDIKKAYRVLAVRLHPDKPGGDTAKFQQLQAAYQEVLKRRKVKRDEEDAVQQMKEKQQASRQKKKKWVQKRAGVVPPEEEEGKAASASATDGTTSDEELEELLRNIKEDTKLEHDELRKRKDVKADDEEEKEQEDEVAESVHSDDDGSEEVKSTSPSQKEDLLEGGRSSKKTDILSDTVEDVLSDDDNEDDDFLASAKFRAATNDSTMPKSSSGNEAKGSVQAAALLKLVIPSKPTDFESDEDHAAKLLQYAQSLLPLLHQAATQATDATQRLIKWQKQWEKLYKESQLSLSRLLDQLLLGAANTLGGQVALVDHISSLSSSPYSSSVSRVNDAPIRRVAPALEVVCDLSQRIAAAAMELASECGSDFAQALGMEQGFLKLIEQAMHKSLTCLRAVVPVSTSLDQLMSCLQRCYDAQRQGQRNTEILDLLTEMCRTAMKNCVATHCGAIDQLIGAADDSTALTELLRVMIQKVDVQTKLDAKRRADYERMVHEEEEEYSAEDREAIRQARQQQTGGGGSNNSKKESSGDEEAEKEAENEKNLSGLDLLKDKIRKLQVQLYLQQISALQTMNAETVSLQDNILQELQSVSLLVPNKREAPVSSNDASSSSNKSKIQGVSGAVTESVVSLVAEMLDASLAQFRQQYQQHRPSLLVDVCYDDFVLRARIDLDWVTEQLTRQLVWCLDVVLSDHSHLKLRHLLEKSELLPTTSSAAPSAKSAGGVEDKEKSDGKVMVPKVALLPDYRAKTLYLASVLDLTAVQDLLFTELPQKLQEIFTE